MEANRNPSPELHARLVELARRGDRAAMDELLIPYLPRLRAYLRRNLDARLVQRESAADLLQSACREVLVDMPAFDSMGKGEAAFRQWLFSTTLRKLLDRQRYHRRRKRDAGQEQGLPTDALLELARSTTSPDRRVIKAEDRQRVLEALDQLSAADAEVIRLIYFDGLTAGEVGKRLGKNRVAVNSQLARALARLARMLRV